MSEKQIRCIQDRDPHIKVYHGPVRSGKSFAGNWDLTIMARTAPEGPLLLSGVSAGSIKRNMVEDLYNMWGEPYVKFFPGKNELYLFGRKIYCIGAYDTAAEGRIRGATFSGCLIDEGTLIPENYFRMATTRLTPEGSMMVVTTNPDNPSHWLKTDVIDSDNPHFHSYAFSLEDNPIMTESMKNKLKAPLTGLFYSRMIEGEWCLAEGRVYDMFDRQTSVIKNPPSYAKYYLVGIDYGTKNPTAFTLMGVNDEASPQLWIEKEYYYDPEIMGAQKTDFEFGYALKEFIGDLPVKRVYIDPSALSFRTEIKKRCPELRITQAKNDVIDGIRMVSRFLHEGTLKICEECQETIREFESYMWDDKASRYGEDRPRKENDHLMDSIKYQIFTHYQHKKTIAEKSQEESDLEILKRKRKEDPMGLNFHKHTLPYL